MRILIYLYSMERVKNKKWNSPLFGLYLILPLLVNSIFLGYENKNSLTKSISEMPKKWSKPQIQAAVTLAFFSDIQVLLIFLATMHYIHDIHTYIAATSVQSRDGNMDFACNFLNIGSNVEQTMKTQEMSHHIMEYYVRRWSQLCCIKFTQ